MARRTRPSTDLAQGVGFTNPWLLFDVYLDAVTDRCEELTLADWRGRIGAVDVFTGDQCYMAVMSVRID